MQSTIFSPARNLRRSLYFSHATKPFIPLIRKLATLSTSPAKAVDLAYYKIKTDFNSSRNPLLILHGLLGSKQNWKSLSKRFSQTLNRDVFSVDLRNHGESPHLEPHTYEAMVQDVAEFCKKHSIDTPVIIGHSMGGKVAMGTSLMYPDMVKGLVTVDMAPTIFDLDFAAPKYLKALEKIRTSSVSDLKQADAILFEVEPSLPKRQFVLTNLSRNRETKVLAPKIPVSILANSIPDMAKWPFSPALTYNKPSVLIGGTKSPYFTTDAKDSFLKQFPAADIVSLPTGHWVHSDGPEEFYSAVRSFVEKNNI